MNYKWGMIFFAALFVVALGYRWQRTNIEGKSTSEFSRKPSAASTPPEKTKATSVAKSATGNLPLQPSLKSPREIPKQVLQKAIPLVTPSQNQLQTLDLKSVDQKWKWWSDAAVITKNQGNSIAAGAVLAEVSQHLVIPRNSQGSSVDEFFPESPLVLFDPLKKRVGLLTGVYIIKARSLADMSELENDGQFEIVNAFSELRLLYVKPKKIPFNLSRVEEFLSRDGRVQSFEYEILKGNLVKN